MRLASRGRWELWPLGSQCRALSGIQAVIIELPVP